MLGGGQLGKLGNWVYSLISWIVARGNSPNFSPIFYGDFWVFFEKSGVFPESLQILGLTARITKF